MRTIRADAAQGATFVELFFDLVFVFAVTQITGLLAHDLTWAGLVRALIIFWLVWWAWTQFTWSLNEADTEHAVVRLLTLVATALAFLMAVTVPTLTGRWGWLFPVSYLLVRVLGIGLQWRLTTGDTIRRGSVLTWTVMSSMGLAAIVVAAAVGSRYRFVALGVAALLDVVAALRAGSGEWHLYPGHFSERHGLFMIIVLGESLIAAGVTAGAHQLSSGLVAVTVIAVIGSCGLWWTYFGWAKPALEQGLASQPYSTMGRFARDVYSFAHFPLIFGVIGFAIAIEMAVAHPAERMPLAAAAALGVGVGLILGMTGVALRRARVAVPIVRWVGALALVVMIPALARIAAWQALAAVTAAVLLVAVAERNAPL
jgi:low temperature requirement protein LtrA